MIEKTLHPLISPGGEPFYFQGNEIGCLLVHGFTDSPMEMRPFGEFLNKKGYTVHGMRTAGHATDIVDLKRMRWQNLLAGVEDGYHLLKSNPSVKKVVIIGHSLGAALTILASSYLDVDGVVALAPAYLPVRKSLISQYIGAFEVFWASFMRKMRSRNLAERLPGWYWYQPELSRGYIKYNQKPIAANLKLIRIINHVPDALPKISAPVLLMGSKKDKIIDSSKMKKVYDSLNVETKEMIWFEKSSHMLPIDGERELVFQKTYEFIEEAVNI